MLPDLVEGSPQQFELGRAGVAERVQNKISKKASADMSSVDLQFQLEIQFTPVFFNP